MIYFDNSATTKPNPSVLSSFLEVSEKFFANPSSIHPLGGESEKLLTAARTQIAQILQVEANEVIFTSGGTEGNSLAIKGIAEQYQSRGRHIITTMIEHPSVYETCKALENKGFDITYLPVNEDGIISVDTLEKEIREDTILISIMHVNHEIGSIQPIEQVGKIAKKHPKLYFHVDGVQGLGKVPLHIKNSGIDLCTFSGHKIHGLNGTGVFYVNNKMRIHPLFHGGEQERKIRSGTENLAGAVAFAKALRLIKDKEIEGRKHLKSIQTYLREELEEMDGIYLNSPTHGAPQILSISAPGWKPEVVIHKLAEKNIYISTKSACSSKQDEPSRVVLACGFGEDRAASALRISLSYDNTKEEAMTFIEVFKETIMYLKKVMEKQSV